jgi:hypothetical protein
MRADEVSIKSSRLVWVFILAALAVLSLVFVGAGRMRKMQTQAASDAVFAQLKPRDDAKIVVEVTEVVPETRIRGRLLEKQDETRYTRTAKPAEVGWGKDTAIVMGKTSDIHAGAILHVTGKIDSDHRVLARQIVILTGYVQAR